MIHKFTSDGPMSTATASKSYFAAMWRNPTTNSHYFTQNTVSKDILHFFMFVDMHMINRAVANTI